MKFEQIRLTPTRRVENGAARRTAIATMDMWPDKDDKGKITPEGQVRNAFLPDGTKLMKHYKLGLRDALGKEIREGEEFTFLDHFGPWVWYYYQLKDVELEPDLLQRMAHTLSLRSGQTIGVEDLTAEQIAEWFGVSTVWVQASPWRLKRFVPMGNRPTRDEALSAVAALKE